MGTNHPTDQLPFGLRCISDGATTIFRYRWFDGGTLAMAAVGAGWWYLIMKCIRHDGRWRPILTVIREPTVVIIIIGLLIAFAVCVGIVNRTEIHLTDEAVQVRNGPLPWIYRNRAILRADLMALEVARYSSGTDDTEYRYQLRAKFASGKDIPIARPVSARGRMRLEYIADYINSRLPSVL